MTTLNIYPYLPHPQVVSGVHEEGERREPGKIRQTQASGQRPGGTHGFPLCYSAAHVHSANLTSKKGLTCFAVIYLYTFLPH